MSRLLICLSAVTSIDFSGCIVKSLSMHLSYCLLLFVVVVVVVVEVVVVILFSCSFILRRVYSVESWLYVSAADFWFYCQTVDCAILFLLA